MKYNFDEVINRRNTNSLKYDFAIERNRPENILPLWVADMDFKTAPSVIERLKHVVEHGIYGYSDGKEDYFEAVKKWFTENFSWEVNRSWLVKTPGVVFAIAMAVCGLTAV